MASTGRAANMIVTSTVLVSLAATAVVLRFTARQKRRLPLKKDDWLSLAGQMFLFAMLIESILWVVLGGAGKHWWHVSAKQKVQFYKIFYTSQITYIIITPIIKLSVLSFYQRIFDVRRFRIITYTLMAVIAVYFTGHFVFAIGFSCRPLRKAWDPSFPGICAAPLPQIISFQSVNIAFDFIILVLPIRMCWKLQRPWQDRAAISAVFLVGAFVCAASIVRLYTVLKIDHSDMSYSIYDASVWTLVEPCIAQVCSCMPVARGLFPVWLPSRPRSSQISASSASSNDTEDPSAESTFLKPSQHRFSHFNGKKVTSDQTHYIRPDYRTLMVEKAEPIDSDSPFEIQRSNSHASKTTTCSREKQVAELDIV